ncbi:MAG: molecular chaperone, partial [Salinarimonadaceae bacterium]
MRQFDLSPLYRSTVGFDRLFSALDQLSGVEGGQTYPPYNIERTGENDYRITLAVAGFTQDDLTIEMKEHMLAVRGAKHEAETKEQKGEFLHQGIAARSFERRFQLADGVQVKGAALEHGLL